MTVMDNYYRTHISSSSSSSVQLKMVSVRSEKPICAQLRLSGGSRTLPLKRLHFSSDWRWHSLVLLRKTVERFPLCTPHSCRRSMVRSHWLCATGSLCPTGVTYTVGWALRTNLPVCVFLFYEQRRIILLSRLSVHIRNGSNPRMKKKKNKKKEEEKRFNVQSKETTALAFYPSETNQTCSRTNQTTTVKFRHDQAASHGSQTPLWFKAKRTEHSLFFSTRD